MIKDPLVVPGKDDEIAAMVYRSASTNTKASGEPQTGSGSPSHRYHHLLVSLWNAEAEAVSTYQTTKTADNCA